MHDQQVAAAVDTDRCAGRRMRGNNNTRRNADVTAGRRCAKKQGGPGRAEQQS